MPASSSPAPLGMHVELADPTTMAALQVYGPYSINVDIWRDADRRLLGEPSPRHSRPHPAIDQIDSMDALILSLEKTELDGIHEWAAQADVRLVAISR